MRKAGAVFAVPPRLSHSHGMVDLSTTALLSELVGALSGLVEEKAIRRVRTPAGVRRYKQPIGSIIVRDGLLRNIELGTPRHEGWEVVRDRHTGTEYELGYDDQTHQWIATTGDSWTPIVSAKSEDELYLILDDHLTPEGQQLPSLSRQRNEQLRPSSNVRAVVDNELGGLANTVTDWHDSNTENNELIGILHGYSGADQDTGQLYSGANEFETRAALRRWIENHPDANPEVIGVAHEAVDAITQHAGLPKRNTIEQDEERGREIASREQEHANTPRQVRLGEVQQGMWINLPDRNPDAWYQVGRVSVHSSARRSFGARDRNGARSDVNQVTNRERILTAASPPSQPSPAGTGTSPARAAEHLSRQVEARNDPQVQSARAAGPHPNLTQTRSEFPGWERYTGANGSTYYVGQEGRNWIITDDQDMELAQGRTRDQALDTLNGLAAPSVPPQAQTPVHAAAQALYDQASHELDTDLVRIRATYGRNRNRWPPMVLNDVMEREAAVTRLRQAMRRTENTRSWSPPNMETKVRHVRTAAGVRRYHQPIGSIILGNGHALHNIRVSNSSGPNITGVRDRHGENYHIRRGSGGQWEAVHGSNVVAHGHSQEDVLVQLDRHVGSGGSRNSHGGNGNRPSNPPSNGSNNPPSSRTRGLLEQETMTRSSSHDSDAGEAYRTSDGTIYHVKHEDGKYVVRDKDGNIVTKNADKNKALDNAKRYHAASTDTENRNRQGNSNSNSSGGDSSSNSNGSNGGNNSSSNSGDNRPPSAPPVGPSQPPAQVRQNLRNSSTAQLRQTARRLQQAGPGPRQGIIAMMLTWIMAELSRRRSRRNPPSTTTTTTSFPIDWVERKADDGEPQTGAMIALIPSPSDLDRLVTEGGEQKDELHLTMAFLGKAVDISEAAKIAMVQAAGFVANNIGPIEARCFSVNIFNPQGEEPCVVLGCGGEALEAVHDAFDSMLKSIEDDQPGFTNAENHKPWVPHITLRYFKNEPIDMKWVESQFPKANGTVTFDTVRVAFGGKHIDIPVNRTGEYGRSTSASDPVPAPPLQRKAPTITPGGRVGDDARIGSPTNGRNWVERTATGSLPRYIRIVRNGLMKQGHDESRATALAVAAIKRWARGSDHVTPKVQAAAAAALAEWEAMKAQKVDVSALDRIHAFMFVKDSLSRTDTVSRPSPQERGQTYLNARMAQAPGGSGGKWDERKHPRRGGKFAPKGSASSSGKSGVSVALAKHLPMKYGQQGKVIGQLQQLLSLSGFETEKDGIFGKRTQDAVKAAQKKFGLEPTGEVDEQLMGALLNASKPKKKTRKGAKRS